MFAVGYLAWTCDAFDFFIVSMTAADIADDFGVSVSDISWVGINRTCPSDDRESYILTTALYRV